MPSPSHVSLWPALPIILVLVFGMKYYLVPIRIHGKPGRPRSRFIPAADAKACPATIAAWLERARTALEAEGFVATPNSPMASASSTAAYASILRQPRTGDVATLLAMGDADSGKGSLRLVGFTAEFSDGWSCYTSNGRLPAVVPERPNTLRYRFPAEQDARRLYALHRAIVARVAGKTQRPIDVDDAVAYQQGQEQKGRQWMIDSGYYRLEGELLRPTWTGAFLSTWRHLPPWRTLTEERDEATRRELLGQLGLRWT